MPLRLSAPAPWETPRFSREDWLRFRFEPVWLIEILDWLPCIYWLLRELKQPIDGTYEGWMGSFAEILWSLAVF